ncbi:MaoC family dehydratase [Chloroflexi bacterium TSY]|nr:MaoC family dehydratase [Chloroflexi bacterium TSY]
MDIHPHQRFCKEVTLNTEMVSEYATAVGDLNPIYHDANYAAGTRFKRLIASGTQTQ